MKIELSKTPIVQTLEQLVKGDILPLHMPGHKQGRALGGALQNWLGQHVLLRDTTEVGDLDSLHNPDGPIAQAAKLLAMLYHSDSSFLLTNGSSAGLIASLLAATQPGGQVLVSRHVHKAVLSGLVLADVTPCYLMPTISGNRIMGLDVDVLKEGLAAHPKAQATVLVSPTFAGVVGDIHTQVRLVQAKGCISIVDEAHGAHFPFHSRLPSSAMETGADLVVQSAHKTLSALTGAAWLHLTGARVSAERLQQALNLVQSTSPSWLLLGSLDLARWEMAERGEELLAELLATRDKLVDDIEKGTGFRVWQPGHSTHFCLDPLKLCLETLEMGYTGYEIKELLAINGIEVEMATYSDVLLMLTVGDVGQDFSPLVNALSRLPAKRAIRPSERVPLFLPEMALTPRAAFYAPWEWLPLASALDRVAARPIYAYPPGIPIVFPGEVIDREIRHYLQEEIGKQPFHGLQNGLVAVVSERNG